MFDRPGLIRILPFGLFLGVMALEPVIQPLLPDGMDPRWLYGLRSALTLVALCVFCREFEEFRNPSPVRASDWGLGVGVGVFVFILWVNLDFQPLALPGSEGFDPRTGGRIDAGLTLVRLAGATLIVPVMEELFWRSLILRWLQHPSFRSVDPATIGFRALLISSALFATEHRLWFAGLLAGLAYGWLYKRTGSLWVPVLAHAVTNGLLGAYVLATGAWTFW